MLPETELHQLRTQWTVEAPSDALADRIIRHALAQPQKRPFFTRVKTALAMRPQQQWAGGLAFAACLMVAVVALDSPTPQPATQSKTVYHKPMDQIVEQMIWNDYDY